MGLPGVLNLELLNLQVSVFHFSGEKTIKPQALKFSILLFLLFLFLFLGFCSDGQHSSGNLDTARDEAFSVTQHCILSFSPPGWSLWGTNGSSFLRGSGNKSICHVAGENKCGFLAHFNFWPGKFKEKRFVQFTSYSKARKQL